MVNETKKQVGLKIQALHKWKTQTKAKEGHFSKHGLRCLMLNVYDSGEISGATGLAMKPARYEASTLVLL